MTKSESPSCREIVNQTVYLCAEALRLTGIMLQPFVPDKAHDLLEMLGVEDGRRGFEWAALGKDDSYGVSRVDLGKGLIGVLFPPLANDS